MAGVALGWVYPPMWVIWAMGVPGLLLVLGGLFTFDADPCDEHLRRIKPNAKHLAQNLANLDNWRSAFEHDVLLDGTAMPRAKAMEKLLYRFTRFFSAAWLYEDHCRGHRLHDEVIDWLREIYKALGEPRQGPTDERVMSDDLHAIGEAGAQGWGTDQVRIKSRKEIETAMSGEEFDPLRRLLEKADPENDAGARLESVEKALERLGDRLESKHY